MSLLLLVLVLLLLLVLLLPKLVVVLAPLLLLHTHTVPPSFPPSVLPTTSTHTHAPLFSEIHASFYVSLLSLCFCVFEIKSFLFIPICCLYSLLLYFFAFSLFVCFPSSIFFYFLLLFPFHPFPRPPFLILLSFPNPPSLILFLHSLILISFFFPSPHPPSSLFGPYYKNQ